MSKFLKILAIILGIIVLISTVITFGGGPYLRNYLNTHGAELLGRRVQVGTVRLNGFTGSLSVDSLFIAEKDDTTRFLSAKQIRTHLNVPRVFLRTYMLDELEADELKVDILQRDTVFNFSDIIERLALDDSTEPLPLVIKDINIHNSYIHYKDSLVGSEFSLNDFQLFIPGIDLRDINTSVGISLNFTEGGTLKTMVDYDDKHKLYSMVFKVDGFNMKGLLPYMRQSIYLGDVQGVINLDLLMQGSVAHLLDFSLKGTAGIKNLNVFDEEGKTMVRCDTVSIDVRDMDLPANRINLSRVHFERPYIRIQYDKDSLDNFTRLILKAEKIWAERDSIRLAEQGIDYAEYMLQNADSLAALAEESSVEYNGLIRRQHLQIDSLLIDSARLSYRDESLIAEPFVYELSNVNIKAPNFSLHGINHITADAQLGREGHLRFWYDGRTLDQRDMHMVVQAEKIEVKDFSPYTVQMFGNEVSSGILSANLMYDTKDGRLLGQNHIIVRNPKVEKKRRGVQSEMNIPFRTGVYILTDKDDVLDINLPVKGDIEDPKFSYKRVLFRTMGKFIVKVCTSPFRRNRNKSAGAEILKQDARNLDDIEIDSISNDLLDDE